MRNVIGASVNEKSTIECSDFLISILKSPTPYQNKSLKKNCVQYNYNLLFEQKIFSDRLLENDFSIY